MKLKIFVVIICVFIILRAVFLYFNFQYKYEDGKYLNYTVFIIQELKTSDTAKSYLAKIKGPNNRYIDKFRINIYNSDKKYSYGDILIVNGKITIPKVLNNDGEFNYKLYLNSKKIYGIINSYDVEYVENKKSNLLGIVYTFKNYISSKIDKCLPVDSAAVLKGMVYGETINMPDSIKEDFEKIGISHLTAVSGSNVALVLLVIVFMLDKIKINNIVKLIIKLFFVCCFCILSSFELSIIRASIMCIISLIYEVIERRISPYLSLLISVLFIAIYNPFALFNTGLQLSCLATLSILMFSKKISNKVVRIIKRKNIFTKILSISLEYASITISAQILILPLQINTFNSFPLSIIFSNVIASFLDNPICILGLLAVIFSFFPLFTKIFCYLTIPFSKTLILSAKLISKFSVTIPISSKHYIIWLFYYIFIGVIFYKDYFKKRKTYRICKLLSLSLFLILLVFGSIYNGYFNNYIYFFNIGQGNMTYVSYKGTNMFIDCGSTNKSNVINASEGFLKKYNITRIDAIIVTHFDTDHINGVINLLKLCKVDRFIFPYVIPETNQVKELFNAVKAKETTLICVKQGDKLMIGNIIINILMPETNSLNSDTNYNSIVGVIEFEQFHFLFMGDATKESEKVILDSNLINKFKISAIQIGHHGSTSSTSDEFISIINPKIAIISSKKSVYGHPHKEVLAILEEYGVSTYITEKLGGIKLRIN